MGNYDDPYDTIRKLIAERDNARVLAEEAEEAVARKHEEAWAWCNVAIAEQKKIRQLRAGIRSLMVESAEAHVKALAHRLLQGDPDGCDAA